MRVRVESVLFQPGLWREVKVQREKEQGNALVSNFCCDTLLEIWCLKCRPTFLGNQSQICLPWDQNEDVAGAGERTGFLTFSRSPCMPWLVAPSPVFLQVMGHLSHTTLTFLFFLSLMRTLDSAGPLPASDFLCRTPELDMCRSPFAR